MKRVLEKKDKKFNIVNDLNKFTCNLSLRAKRSNPSLEIASGYCPRNDNFLGSSIIVVKSE